MDKTLELVMIIIQRIIKSLLMRVSWNDEWSFELINLIDEEEKTSNDRHEGVDEWEFELVD